MITETQIKKTEIFYPLFQGTEFRVEAGSLSVSVATYTVCALICIAILVMRRYLKVFGRGELGGPSGAKWASSVILVTLWFIYIIVSALKAYKKF